MLNSLLASFPESGLQLYREMDYWECKELLDIASTSKASPGDRLQIYKNELFNKFLNSVAKRKFKWQFIESRLDLRQIRVKTKEILL